MAHVTFTDIATNEVFLIARDEWIARCAKVYVERAGLSDGDARKAAEENLAAVEADPEGYEYESPEDMAHGDMDCWTEDGEE